MSRSSWRRGGPRSAALLFATGAVSGTALSFELGLLWPGLMGIYLYGWGRLPGRVHAGEHDLPSPYARETREML